VLLISFYVIAIIVSIVLKLYLKTIDKQTIIKTIKFVIEIDQKKRISTIKIDASF